MAFSLVVETRKTPTAGPGANAVTSDAVDTTGATLIVLSVPSRGLSVAPVITDSKGNTWTSLTARQFNAASARFQLFYCISPTVGSGHTFTFTGNGGYASIRVMAFATAGTPVFDGEIGNNGATTGTTIAPGSLTPTVDNALVISGVAAYESGSAPVVTGSGSLTMFTWIPKSGSYPIAGGYTGYVIQTTAGAVSPTYTWVTSAENASASAAFRETAPPDVTAPTVDSATIAADGVTLTVVFDEAVTGDGTGFELDDATGATYVSGDGTDTWAFALASVVYSSDTPTLEYDAGVGDMEDLETSPNALATFTGQSIDNLSTQEPDVTAPELTSVAMVGATTLRLTADEPINISTLTGLSLSASGGAVTLSGPIDGPGTVNVEMQTSRSIASTESLAFSYDSGTGDIEDTSGNALASISNRLVTNNISASGGSGISRARIVNQGG